MNPRELYNSIGDPDAFWSGLDYASRFFMGDADVQRALSKIVAELEDAKIPYAIAGGMAVNAHGYRRVTVDLDLLLTSDGLRALKQRVLGHGYVERLPGKKSILDIANNVRIDVLIAGEFPGDRKPKPVAFPDPQEIAFDG